ncbi:MAG: Nif3-like dinuclear metal center hexameric protein [Planctomycetota bacterium]
MQPATPSSSDSVKLDRLCGWLAQEAPLRLAESWDNVGLLVGDRQRDVQRVMTCLTLTPDVADEAVNKRCGLVVTHHPIPFKPLAKLTTDSTAGAILLRLIENGVAVYSAHTAFDSASEGINSHWADAFELIDSTALIPETIESPDQNTGPTPLGAGRYGQLPQSMSLRSFIDQAAQLTGASMPRIVGDPKRQIQKVGFSCGSGGSFQAAPDRCGCDALLTGEATFHVCLDARARGIALAMIGHYCSERFAMERWAKRMQGEHAELEIWASQSETDPVVPL